MHKMFFLILMMFVFQGCSDRSVSPEQASPQKSEDVVQNEVDFLLNVTSIANPAITEVINFGELGFVGGVSRRANIFVKNSTGSSIVFPVDHFVTQLDNQIPGDYILSSNTCDGKSISNGRTCKLSIRLKYSQVIESLGTVSLNITEDEQTSPFFSLALGIDLTYVTELSNHSGLVVSQEVINMGRIVKDGSSKKRVIVSNVGSAAPLSAPTLSMPLPSGVSIENDSCGVSKTPVSIAPLRSCYFYIKYDYQGVPDVELPFNESIVLNSVNISETGSRPVQIQGINVADINSSSVKLVVREANFPSEPSLNAVYTRRMYVSNPTEYAYTFGADEFSSQVVAPYEVKNNTCDGQTIRGGSYCYVDITLTVTSLSESVNEISLPNANVVSQIVSGQGLSLKYNNGVQYTADGIGHISGDVLEYQMQESDITNADVYNEKFNALQTLINNL